MREVIQQLIEAEGEAKRLVESAHREAERLVGKAEAEAQATLTRVRAEVRVQAGQLVQAAVEHACAEKKQRLEEAHLQIQTELQLDPDTRSQLVQAVVEFVCGTSKAGARAATSSDTAPTGLTAQK
jgi:vacuolar-type H+-ATPase subunit H